MRNMVTILAEKRLLPLSSQPHSLSHFTGAA
jgi:hypothetical protein